MENTHTHTQTVFNVAVRKAKLQFQRMAGAMSSQCTETTQILTYKLYNDNDWRQQQLALECVRANVEMNKSRISAVRDN